MSINERISALRHTFHGNGVKAFIVPSTDPHQSEYVAPYWESRKWISGFTGSAGTVVITDTESGLWTDSRYFLQAADQLARTEVILYKEKLPETPSIPQFLASRLHKGDAVGINGSVFSVSAVRDLQAVLEPQGIEVRNIGDPFGIIWGDRPTIPANPVFILEQKYAGKPAHVKIAEIRSCLSARNADALLISALDEIAWTLNLRGTDVHCNPVFVSYLLITQHDAVLFINPEKVDTATVQYLREENIKQLPYESVTGSANLIAGQRVLLNPSQTNYEVFSSLSLHTAKIVEGVSPVSLLKAIRNQTEIKNIHQAMARDGVAMVRFLIWLEQALPTGTVTEVGIDAKLHELRSAQPLFKTESFDTIAGYGPHGAIVHYEATPETDVKIEPKGLLLIDSGAQYLDGSTDITRTLALGPLTEEECEAYTLVLKGHIDMAMAVFPQGTRGSQIDILARLPLWKRHLNYLHGTGHGVGSFLNVHEGPQSIRMEENPITLQAGMVVTNEPGIYKAGKHGVRTENTMMVVPSGEGMFGHYLKLESLTLCPIDKQPIIRELLNDEEVQWLDTYHQRVYDILSPLLEPGERSWLANATAPL